MPKLLLACLCTFFLMGGCVFTRPAQTSDTRTPSYAVSTNEPSAIKTSIHNGISTHSGMTGFRLITHGQDALLMRIALIQAAQKSLDMQYYSIEDDDSGQLLLEAVLSAADRGVRVRILVDDITLKKSDAAWSLLNSHPKIELRVFNPFAAQEKGQHDDVEDIGTAIERFTRRMHNKAFIADNQVCLIGGRNLGDAYFDNSQDFNFRDVDLLAAGPTTQLVSKNFDSFWNGQQAFPIGDVTSVPRDPDAMQRMRAKLKQHWQDAVQNGALARMPSIIDQLKSNQPPLLWATAQLEADSPAKVDQPEATSGSKPLSKLEQLSQGAQHELIAVSPYLVPGDDGMQWIEGMIQRGVHVRMLTNSLASTDVVAVHTGYRRYREALIKDGVDLYEMKPLPGHHPRSGRFASASHASLHTKLFIIDRRTILIGTMNLDPRSRQLNTEIGLVITDPQLAQQLVDMFEKATSPASSYRVTLQNGSLQWTTEQDDKEKDYGSEPDAGLWRRIETDLYAIIPFESEL